MAGTLGGGLIALVVSLLVGGAAIFLGAMAALKTRSYTHALLTAGLGAIAWILVGYLLAELSLAFDVVSGLVGMVVWIGVIRWRYDAGWLRAGLIGLFAWVAALVVLSVLGALGVGGIEAFGVPGA